MKRDAFGLHIRRLMKGDFHMNYDEVLRDAPEKDVYLLYDLFMLGEELDANTVPRWKFNHLLEAIPYWVFIVGIEGQVLAANSNALDRFGYERKNLIGLPFERVLMERQWKRLEAARDSRVLLGFRTCNREVALAETQVHFFPSPEGHPREMLIMAKEIGIPGGAPLKPPTDAEFEVLKRLLEEMKVKDIAKDLGCSPRTVESHLASLRKKWNARNRMHLVLIAYKAGYLG